VRVLTLVILTLLSFKVVSSADINATLIKADTKVYINWLKELKSENNTTDKGSNNTSIDEITLQETLLERLISLSKKDKTLKKIPSNVPSNEKEYRLRFGKYEGWLDKKAKILKELEGVKARATLTKKRLDELIPTKNNHSKIITLQLQYAFYRRTELILKRDLNHYQLAIDATPKLFIKALKKIVLNSDNAIKQLKRIKKSLDSLNNKIQQLKIQKERSELLNKSSEVEALSKKIDTLAQGERSFYQNEIMELFILFSNALEFQDEKKAFNFQRDIKNIAPLAFINHTDKDLISMMNILEQDIFGQLNMIKGITLEKIQDIFLSIWVEINRPLFSINDTPISAFKLILALFIFIISIIIGILYKKSIKKLSFRSRTITPSTQTLLSNLGFYIIILIAFFAILKILGINLTSIALVAGALTVGIGFGLQTIVSNFVSGLILMFERSIKIGDYLDLGDDLRGYVSDIRMRSTTITTNDNIDVVVPNQDLIQNRVINWTMKDQIRRFRIPFGVAYGTDIDFLERVILKAVKENSFLDIYTDKERFSRVVMVGMGDSSINFELYVWIKGAEIHYPRRTTSRFLKLIYKTLYENKIEIPFPQRDLHLRSSDIPLELLIKKDRDELK